MCAIIYLNMYSIYHTQGLLSKVEPRSQVEDGLLTNSDGFLELDALPAPAVYTPFYYISISILSTPM